MRWIGLAALAAVATLGASGASAQTIELKYALFTPPTNFINKEAVRCADEVKQKAGAAASQAMQELLPQFLGKEYVGLVGLVGYAAVSGWDRAVRVLGQVPFDMASAYDLSVVPMFVLMGELATRSGMSAKLYTAARALFVGFRGSQALATLGACAAFGAVCGSSLATAAIMTRIAIPEMRRLGYDDRLSTGSVAAGGSLGILIPPSIPLVIYAIIAEQSVARLFAAGMIPGLPLTALYMLMAVVVLLWKPGWARKDPAMGWRARIAALGSCGASRSCPAGSRRPKPPRSARSALGGWARSAAGSG